MQFLWKYIDDLIGKGLELTVLLELLFYVSATLIPLALPLAVLFSSIMTYGNLAEHNELTALKSAGVSLLKVMRPMFYFIVLLCFGAFYFTNYLLPIANYKWRTIIYDIQQKKPTFGITPGIFYNDIDGYSIRVDDKDDATGSLFGVLIYEYSDFSTGKTIKAKSGEMLKSENDQFLLLKLNSGAMYEKLPIGQFQKDRHPFQKTFFDEAIIKFDLSGFQMQQSNEDLFKRDFEMLNFIQLKQTIDSLEILFDLGHSNFNQNIKRKMLIYNDLVLVPDTNSIDSITHNLLQRDPLIDTIIDINKMKAMEVKTALASAQLEIRTRKEMLLGQINFQSSQQLTITQFVTALHKKFTLPFAVLVLFFVGAPLGAIIKKGGLGAPLIFATLFFLLYYTVTIMGENMVESGFLVPWKGMWLSSAILAPLGIFLTYKAANDSALFDRDVYKKYFSKIFKSKG
jgi:lipopolysaccharide export system permease protein